MLPSEQVSCCMAGIYGKGSDFIPRAASLMGQALFFYKGKEI
jgi:hypothetical protein